MGVRYVNPYYKHPDGYMVGLTRKGEEFYFDEEDLDIVLSSSWCIGARGLFIDILEAAKAYNEGALKYHGEFASSNSI